MIMTLLIATGTLGWLKYPFFTAKPKLQGLWSASISGCDAYTGVIYFDNDGTGKHQDRRASDTLTMTFHYEEVSDGQIRLTIDETGETFDVGYSFEDRSLRLNRAPFGSLSSVLYQRRNSVGTDPHIYASYTNRTEDGFSTYQLLAPRIGGRGEGWLHEGTAERWTTTRVRYRLDQRWILVHSNDASNPTMFRRLGTRALLNLTAPMEDGRSCAFVYTPITFSRWMNGVPLPPAARKIDVARFESECQLSSWRTNALRQVEAFHGP